MDVLTWLAHMAPHECADLLAVTSVGRLGVIVDGRPEIFPINHVYDRESGCIVFPTTPGTKYHAALNWPTVAFEIDGVEPDGEHAWSVAVVGRAEELTDPLEIERITRQRSALWASGSAARWLRIVPNKITGRRISAAWR